MSFYGEGMNLDDIDDEQVWISPPFHAKSALHSGLADFEQTLRCPICGELLHVPVSIQPCQHSFCSECIQSHVKAGLASLKREAKCPVCRQVVPRDMKCLVPNRTVETLVRQYKGFRNALKEALVSSCCQVKGKEGRTCCCKPNAGDENEATTGDSARNPKRCRTARSDMTTPPAPNVAPPNAAIDPQSLGVEVTELRKKLPNTHYKGMNRIKLAELCRNEGLSTNGDAAVLKARHQAFVSLYNAECDSFTPRSAQQIAQEINRREIAIKTEQRHAMMAGGHALSSSMEQLKRNREAAGKDDSVVVVSSGNEAFDAKLNNGFAVMVEALQRMKKQEQAQRKPMPTKTNDESTSTTVAVASAETTSAPAPASKPIPPLVPQALVTTPGVTNGPSSYATGTPPTNTGTPHTASALSTTTKQTPFSTPAPMPRAIDVYVKAMNVSESQGLREYNNRREHHDQMKPREHHHKLASPGKAKGPAELAIAARRATHATGLQQPSPSVYQTTAHRPLLAVTEDSAMGSKEQAIASKLTLHTPAPKGPMRTFARKKIPTPPSVVGGTAKGESIIGPWTCSKCTFHNTKNKWSRAKCEVCYFARGAKSTSFTGTATETDGVISMDC